MRTDRLVALAAVTLLASACAYAAGTLPLASRLVEPLELTTLDWRVRSAAHGAPSAEVALVLFDSASVEDWPYLVPFPRAVLARLIDSVSRSGASVIALDVYLDRLYPQLEPIGGGDALLRDAIRRAGNVVLVADVRDAGGDYVLRPPHPYFAEVAAGVAAADLPTPYETVRAAVLAVRTSAGTFPGIGLALYSAHRGLDLDSLLEDATRNGTLSLPALRTPTVSAGGALITMALPFRGPPSHTGAETAAFNAFPASAVLELGEMMPREWLAGRVVLLGSGYHSEDRFRTPFHDYTLADNTSAGWTYGTEIHATAVDGLLAGGVPMPLPRGALPALLLLLSLGIAGATFLRGVTTGAVSAAVATGLLLLASWDLFARSAIHLPLIVPSLAAGFALTLSSGWVSIVEGRDKRRIRSAFARYLAPEIVAELAADPRRLRLGGEKRQVTIMFADLVGFTYLCESAPPERIVSLLNEYLDAMTDVVLAEGGMLDKYIGDAVMALFGAPRAQPDHALRACRAALRMQRRVRELNHAWRADGWPPLAMRIGIHTGEPLVGNIGGSARFDYTALGDPVNVAARLEPACRTYGVDIIISGTTAAALDDSVITRELDLITVAGRNEAVPIHELVAESTDVDPQSTAAHEQFAAGLEAYRRRDFVLAEQYFAAAATRLSDDGATRLYIERCRSLRVSPPPADWDFITRRATK